METRMIRARPSQRGIFSKILGAKWDWPFAKTERELDFKLARGA